MYRHWLVLLGAACTAAAAFAGPIEDQIRYRQSAYSFVSWNTGRIKAQVIDRPETFNAQQVLAAANAVAAVANSGLGALYAPGTEQGSGWKPSRLKPEYFQEPERARAIALEFNRAANQLAKVAAAGDRDQIKEQYLQLSKTCKSCHDSFRARE
jgi:cytochrome c556